MYVGNSQFIGKRHILFLEKILMEVQENAKD
jgi:hypothetical protein